MELNNKSVRSFYNISFPLERFDMSLAIEMDFKTVVKKDNYFLRYMESLKKDEDKNVLILDFDGYAENINPEECMETADNLHTIINEEYENTIKEPLKDFMRKKKEE